MSDFVNGELHRIWDVFVFVYQHTVAYVTSIDLKQLFAMAVAVTAKRIHDRVRESPYFRHFAVGFVLIALGVIFYVFSTTIHQSHVEMSQFVLLLVMWGIAVYVLITESLLLGLARQLNKLNPKGRWIREIEYPYLLLGLVGLFVTINRLTMLERRITDYDLYGPLILVTGTAIKLVKTRAEVSDWGNL